MLLADAGSLVVFPQFFLWVTLIHLLSLCIGGSFPSVLVMETSANLIYFGKGGYLKYFMKSSAFHAIGWY